MAATALTVVEIPRWGIGVDPGYESADSANGNSFVNDGKTRLIVRNGGGSSINVTVTSPASPLTANEQLAKVTAVPAGEDRIFGPFKRAVFNDDGAVIVDFSDDTSVTVAAVRDIETNT